MTRRRDREARTPPWPRLPQSEPVTRLKAAGAGDDYINVNCGRCGHALWMRVDELRGLRTVDCEGCAEGRAEGAAPWEPKPRSQGPHETLNADTVLLPRLGQPGSSSVPRGPWRPAG